MTGSVRGALSNERPYRDRACQFVSTCELDRARRAHAVGCQWWARRAKRAFAHPTNVDAQIRRCRGVGYSRPREKLRTDTVWSNVIARYRNASATWQVQSCTGLGLGSGCRQPSCQPGDG